NGGNGFTAAVALETGDGAGWYNPYTGAQNLYTIDSYVPHVVGGVGWTGGWGGVSAVAGYDSVYEEFAIKGRVDFNVNDAFSLFVMAGYASKDDDEFISSCVSFACATYNGPNYYGQWGGDWAIWGGGTFKATEQATINVQLAYDDFEN